MVTDQETRDDETYRMARRIERIAHAIARAAAQLAEIAESSNRARLETLECLMKLSVEDEVTTEPELRIKQALDTIARFGPIDGAHHKAWVIDQITRTLTGDEYQDFVHEQTNGGEYEWDEGVAP